MAKTSGEIKEVFIEEGKAVKAGDKLFTTNALETNLQLEQVNAQIDTYGKRIDLLKRAEANATKGTNDFSKSDAVESEFYNRLNAAYMARKEFEVDVAALKKQAVEQVEADAANQNAGSTTNTATKPPESQSDDTEQSKIDAEQQAKIDAENKAKIEASKKKQIEEKMQQIDDYAKSQKNKCYVHLLYIRNTFLHYISKCGLSY